MLKFFGSILLKILSLLSWLTCPALIILVFYFVRPGGAFFVPFIFHFYEVLGDKIAELLHTSNWFIMLILVLLCFAAAVGTCFLVIVIAFMCAYFLYVNIWASSIDVYNSYCYDKEKRKNIPHAERQTGAEWKQKSVENMGGENAKTFSGQQQYKDESQSTYGYNYKEYTEGFTEGYTKGRRQGMEDHRLNPEDNEFEIAKRVFMLDDVDFSTITLEDLKKRRDHYLKIFHPDASESSSATADTQKILHYFDVLKEHLSQ